jgi:hypothetical protein
VLRRADPDRRQRASLVREPGRAVHAAGLYRRCHKQDHATAFRSQRKHRLVLRGPARLSRCSRLPCGFLFQQAFGVPHQQARGQGRTRHDTIRSSAGRAEHRDPVCELPPGQGPRGTGQPDFAGPPGEGAARGWHLRDGCRKSLPTWIRGALQRPILRAGSEAREPTPPGEDRSKSPQ